MSDNNYQLDFELICQNCKNTDFIIHKPGELQCSKCGKYVDSETLKKAQFTNKYSRKTQQSILDKKVAEIGAKHIITIQMGDAIPDGGYKEIGFPFWIHSGSKIEIYKAEKSVISAYYIKVDIYEYYDWEVGYLHSPGPEVELLLISDKLPKIHLKGSDGGTVRVPVSQGPDNVVFTGATVGGITTGGFHTQPGKIQYETKTVSGYKKWELTGSINIPSPEIVGRFSVVSINASKFIVLTHINSYPERYEKYFKNYLDYPKKDLLQPITNYAYVWKAIVEKSSQVKEPDGIWSPHSSFPLGEIMHVLIYQDALPDADYYDKACTLLTNEKRTSADLKEAAAMFDRLGDYRDSILKRQTCLHEIENGNYKKEGCYIATAVYGSYDCPQVWTLRRYRDYTLAETWYGCAFIRTYYAISPTLVKWFGKTEWFKNIWKPKLDKMVKHLNDEGLADTPYQDRHW